jgi:hypothetical protein
VQSGEGFTDGRAYTIQEYRVMADAFSKQWWVINNILARAGASNTRSRSYRHEGKLDMETLEKDYWDAIEAQTCEMKVRVVVLPRDPLLTFCHRWNTQTT